MQSYAGVRAVYDGQAIPPLVRLLDDDDRRIVCRITRILSKMTRHWGSCMSMLQGGILPLFIRLLSREIEEEVLTALAHILAQAIPMCSPECRHYIRALSRDDLQTLIGHLNLGCMEIRLAAAEAIQGIARADVSDITQTLKGSNTDLSLCHLLLDCRNSSEEETVTSVIDAINVWCGIGTEADSILRTQILPGFMQLLRDDNSDMAMASCRILRHLYYTGEFHEEHDEEILLRLTRLLSHADIHVFVEAAWTASTLAFHDESHPTLPEIFDLTVIQGVTRLLHHQDDQVVVKALRGLADVSCDHLVLDILFEMVNGGGIPQLVRLLSSNNVEITAAALDLVRCCIVDVLTSKCRCQAITRLFIRHGAIAALVRNITSSNPLLHQTINTLWWFPRPQVLAAILDAGADKHLLHLLSTSDIKPRTTIIVFRLFRDDDFIVFKDAGISQLLVPFARRVMDMSDSAHEDMMSLLSDFILADESFCEEFRVAGAESLIADYLAGIPAEHDLHDDLTKCLELLQLDSEHNSKSD